MRKDKINSNKIEKTETLAEKIIQIAKNEVWIVEWTKIADSYGWFKSKDISWCAAFVNWCLKQSWLKWSGNNLALSFIWLSWYWHTWIKNGDKMISGNWWNKVSLSSSMKQIASWYAIPTKDWLKKNSWKIAFKDIPEWAIVSWRRNPKSWLWA